MDALESMNRMMSPNNTSWGTFDVMSETNLETGAAVLIGREAAVGHGEAEESLLVGPWSFGDLTDVWDAVACGRLRMVSRN